MNRDEDALVRMIRNAGSPEAAGQGLIERLEALEAAVAELERRSAGTEHDAAFEEAPDDPDLEATGDPAPGSSP